MNSPHQPPRFALRFLRWFCPDHLYEEIEGDLMQKFNGDVMRFGERRAKRRLMWNAMRFFRPGILARNKFDFIKNQNLMLGNHTKVIVRQVARNKTFSVINMLGLTTGITVCLLVTQFVLFESSFESFNKNADRTYRVNLFNTSNGVFTKISPGTVSGLGYAIRQSIPGVESIARLSSKTTGVVRNKDQKIEYLENDIVYADPSIINVLAIDLIEGNKNKILKGPQSILISETSARKYFGEIHVIGKVLEIGFNNGNILPKSYQIEGVFHDIPANAHQHFQFVLPPENEQAWNENWAWSDVKTYIVLSQHAEPASLERGLSEIVKQHHQDGIGDHYLLEPITEIRLHALDGSGRATLVNFFLLLGVIILLLAWFNYINLSTARFFERMKEVGVRKLIGASRVQLVLQFLMETFFFNLISFSCAVILFFLIWPPVTQFLGQEIPITLFNEPLTFTFILGFVLIGTLCSGFYPSLFLSSFRPLQSLKGRVTDFADRSTLRKVIVVIQLSVSIVLITAALAIQWQIGFMREQNLGIAIDQTLIIEEPLLTDPTTVRKFETFKNEILQLSSVQGVTYASSFPGTEIDWHRADITLGQENADYRHNSRIIAIGTEFLDVFGLPLMTGRNFNPEIESDKKAMLISEEASKMFGFENYSDALGKLIFIGSRRFEVIGVVKNYHYRSLQNQIQPVLYMQGHPRGPRYAIKLSFENIAETISKIESKWKKTYAGNVFRYYFLDDFFDRQYTTERQIGTIVSALTLLAIFISCSGLFGLSLYSVSRRTKEIGIRKVLGATVSNVVLLLSRDFVKLMMIGAVLTVPLVYHAVKLWLERYAYKMPVDGWLFIFPVVTVMLLVLITISFQTSTAAKKNPVESMKYE